jgi:putative addiction module component (TIGR02574 family)
MANVDDLTRQALGLAVDDRAALAERLLASLDDLEGHESDRLWGDEAERRLTAYRRGSAAARPAADVHARAERLLRD